jgi:hypothetical protein
MSDKAKELAAKLVGDMEVRAHQPKRGPRLRVDASRLIIQRLSDWKRLVPADPPEVQAMDEWLGNEPNRKPRWE